MAASDSDLIISISTDLATIRNQLKKFGDLADQAGARASSSFARAGKDMDDSISGGVTKVQRRVNDMVGIIDQGARKWTGALANMGDQLDRLAARYDPLIAAQQKYASALKDINTAEAYGAIGGARAIDARLAATSAYNNQASYIANAGARSKASAQSAVNVATISPNRGADIAAYAEELDRLKAKYSPLFAAQREYLAELAEIKQAYAVGAITAEEMSSAVARTKAGFAGSVVAINATRKVVDESTKSFKLNRIGMMELQASGINAFQALAAGMSPFRVATMEGAQVVGAFVQGADGGFKGLINKIGSASSSFAAMLGGPLPAIALALVTLGSVGAVAFSDIEKKAISAADSLKAFKSQLDEIKKTAPDVAKSVERIFNASDGPNALLAGIKLTKEEIEGGLTQALQKLEDSIPHSISIWHGMTDYAGYHQLLDMVDAAKQGAITVADLRDKLAQVYLDPKTDQSTRDLAGTLLEDSKDARGFANELAGLNGAIGQIGSVASAQIKDVNALTSALSKLAGIEVSGPVSPSEKAHAAFIQGMKNAPDAITRTAVRGAYDQAMARIQATIGPYGTAVPKPGERPNPESFAPKRSGSASHKALDAFQRGMQSTDAQLKQLQARASVLKSVNPLIDDYGASMAEATKKQQLLSDAEKAGVSLSPAQLAAIDKQAAAYGKMTGAVNQATSANERLKSQMDNIRNTGKDVLGGFIKDLESGKSAAQALGDALQKVADKLLNSAMDSLFNPESQGGADILGGLFGGSKSGGLFGGAIIPGILHAGGVAGHDGYGHGRSVSPAMFAGATRYHTGGVAGLKPGEIPAILQRGEIVLPRMPSIQRSQAATSTPSHITVNVDGANGDQHVISLVRQGVSQGLQAYDRQLTATFGGRMSTATKRQG